MPLPTTRDLTYVPGSVVSSANLNNLQDTLIANYAAVAAETAARIAAIAAEVIARDAAIAVVNGKVVNLRTQTVHAFGGRTFQNGSNPWVDDLAFSYVRTNVDPTDHYLLPLPIESGQTVTIKIVVQHSLAIAGAVDVFLKSDDSVGLTTNVAMASSAATTAWQLLTIVSGHVVVTGSSYYIRIAGGTGGVMERRILHALIEYTR
jgi:hypothetical protein